jgi:hypothetical protein
MLESVTVCQTLSFFISLFTASEQECWVCYDSERRDAGDMIYPCQCKGDVAAVHHECLRRWLLEVHKSVIQMYTLARLATSRPLIS